MLNGAYDKLYFVINLTVVVDAQLYLESQYKIFRFKKLLWMTQGWLCF